VTYFICLNLKNHVSILVNFSGVRTDFLPFKSQLTGKKDLKTNFGTKKKGHDEPIMRKKLQSSN